MLQRANIDWVLFGATIPLVLAGLVTMNSFTGDEGFFGRQLLWLGLSFVVFFGLSLVDFRFLRRSEVLISLYVGAVLVLVGLLFFGETVNGARSWFDLGPVSIQPSDPVKLVLILVLAKYFSRRHIEIANFRHILVSGGYAFVFFGLIFLQPDFGTAVVIFAIWLGMVLVSGISKKHLLAVIMLAAVSVLGAWFFAFDEFQKERLASFLEPASSETTSGYNARQAAIAVGAGGLFGQGVGYGTQSRLAFLPEHQSDFIFASFAEEWGFVGVVILFALFGLVFWRIIWNAASGETNFEVFYGLGVAVFLMSHFILHVGINIGLLPVTGTTIPFLSYGGSHLLTEYAALGILMSMRGYARSTAALERGG